jgi:prepilin-type N-terminal cleavage/methylation domain-containing protein
MKKTNKGFTIVELIIVIAVIGILAAILIPAFSNIIEKANAKSAYSDARGALSTYLANTSTDDEGVTVPEGTIFIVLKAKKFHQFIYEDGQLRVDGDPEDATYNGDEVIAPETPENYELVEGDARNLIPDTVYIFKPADSTENP